MISLDCALNDYARKDMYELVKYYYRPRVEAYLTAIRAELAGKSANPADLKSDCKKILVDFVKTDHPVSLPPAGSSGVENVRRLLYGGYFTNE